MLALCAICCQAQAQPEPPRYRFEKVPTDDPSCTSSGSRALDLNNAGAVIGQRCIDSNLFAFIAHNGNITLLPQDEEGNASQLHLNDQFDVIMSVSSEVAGKRNLLVLNDGAVVPINPLPDDFDLTLVSLNNSRQVLAWSVGSSSSLGFIPMIWQDGQGTPLSALPGSARVRAVNLNENGDAIGWSSSTLDEFETDVRAVLWRGGTVTELPLPRGAIGSRGRDLNDGGQAVLSAYFGAGACGAGRSAQAYLWQRGRLRALPLLPIGEDDFDLTANPVDINNVGEVVGITSHRNCWDPPTITLRATLWRDRAVYDLKELLVDENGAPVTNVTPRRALAINDAGQILVEAFFDPLDHPEFYLLTPVATAGN
jgi:uncharacterized membrane protein